VAQKKKRSRPVPSASPRTRPGSPAKGRSGNPAKPPAARKATARDWISGARIRTLPLAVAPVAIGAGAARAMGPDSGVDLGLALLCLAVAVLLQVGVNYANDYSDGIRGTDAVRVGPARLTGSGAAKPRTVLTVALAFFGLAAVAGLVIVLITGHWWLLAVGAVAIVAAYYYTGGKRPYGYAGLGDVVVFAFFGLVATAGTQFILIGRITGEGWLGGVAAGGFACAVLMVNNIRDIDQDGKVGKRTLAVRLGPRGSRIVYCVEVALAYTVLVFFSLFYPRALLVLFTLVLALPAAVIACTGRTPKELILSLQLTSMAALTFGLGLGAAFAF
jgi:1,4-dihydroxy-2-naphthoate octaprenyltransferase